MKIAVAFSLGIKQCRPNPWEEFSVHHAKGDRISGNIKSITDFGIFIGLDGGIDGTGALVGYFLERTRVKHAVRRYSKGEELEDVGFFRLIPKEKGFRWVSNSWIKIPSPILPRLMTEVASSQAQLPK